MIRMPRIFSPDTRMRASGHLLCRTPCLFHSARRFVHRPRRVDLFLTMLAGAATLKIRRISIDPIAPACAAALIAIGKRPLGDGSPDSPALHPVRNRHRVDG